ncbi:hypothetical protein DLAC_02789 [Tieghemostelium lacteum]|uniref:Profilin n=1 Tax=Tieghemostelium lacteum TaxID=361077 RepID=A0A152A3E4_TIELA|nr:hypothetical protein DLAC_02789 [Tieghemostelium lacteum]|eukprot:KYR00746.1 hypothetical protein DLAC_02789 [Tieghemostelium lacteum]
MTWDSIIDNFMVSKGFKESTIIGLDGSTWGYTPGCFLTAEEIKNILDLFETKPKENQNIKLAGEQFQIYQARPREIYAKNGIDNVIIEKNKKSYVVGIYQEDKILLGNALINLQMMSDYIERSYKKIKK